MLSAFKRGPTNSILPEGNSINNDDSLLTIPPLGCLETTLQVNYYYLYYYYFPPSFFLLDRFTFPCLFILFFDFRNFKLVLKKLLMLLQSPREILLV